ncbi:hypothetical protein N9R10_00950 [Pseudomonadales bacterium]|nr:hypothetical protein [Pseudomonadales bacterium]
MPARITYTAIFLIPLLLTGCQTVNNSIDAIGGIFSSKQAKNCTGADCGAESLLDNRETNQNWYCYGTTKEADWDCQNAPDQAKIVPITDATRNTPTDTSIWPAATVVDQSLAEVAVASVIDTQPANLAPDSLAADSLTADSTATADDAAIEEPNGPSTSTSNLLDQPASYYTVQLIAMKEELNILNYARLNGLDDPLHVQIMVEGAPWYVLLLGIYPDQATADLAKDQWVRAKNLKVVPWIRRLGPLQDAIRQVMNENEV